MTRALACPRCGSTGPRESVADQCPLCLFELALAADPEPAAPRWGPDGSRLGGYALGAQIGSGGMGVVYEAWRLKDQQRVAVKVIRDSHVASPARLRRFMIEADAAARLDHPHIVRIHEIGEEDGFPFFSMDFVDGSGLMPGWRGRRGEPDASVADVRDLAQSAPDLIRLAVLMAKMARAVQHAHERGVLHRDLKPSNILIDASGEPRLTDFGLAKILAREPEDGAVADLTGSGDLPGTPSYMAPEQVTGAGAGPWSDVYGLGAVLYAMLTGRPPFQGATPMETFRQIMEQPPVQPRRLNPSVPRDLQTITLKCLEKDPRRRYASAKALAEDLDRFAEGRRILARPAGPVRRSTRWIRRNPAGAALIASLCLGLTAALALLKVVNDQRLEIQLDRDLAFDEGMRKISLIWRDPAIHSVTISARELAILDGRSPADAVRAAHQLSMGAHADDSPASVAQRHARQLGALQDAASERLGESIALHLRLLKRPASNAWALARGEVDFMTLGAASFLEVESSAPGVTLIGFAGPPRATVLFARIDSNARALEDLRGMSVVFPDPSRTLTVMAKARLFEAGLTGSDLGAWTHVADQGPDLGGIVLSASETVNRVLRGDFQAGVTSLERFERYRHLGLVALDQFEETPDAVAARSGLDPGIVSAMRHALRNTLGNPRTSGVARIPAPSGALEETWDAQWTALRRARDQAAQFAPDPGPSATLFP